MNAAISAFRIAAIPVPGALPLLALALGGLVGAGRLRRRG